MNLEFWKNWLGVELSAVSPKEKALSALGGLISILITTLLSIQALHTPAAIGVIASMGASAVLLFAVPHGQLSQPWPVIAGHGFSALIGVLCAKWIHPPELAAACAVGLAIAAMHQFKCIHPPGGATALTAVLGSQSIHEMGFRFVLFPVLTNALTMVAIAVLFNAAFQWRRYPAFFNHPKPPPATAAPEDSEPSHEAIVKALRSLDSFVDVTEDDLIRLVKILGHHEASRNRRE
ncbi:MAG: HPP family protein [Verrucomicrobiota bacterium]